MHFTLSSLFTFTFYNTSVLFPVFLLGLSQGTPIPTLKPFHRQDGNTSESHKSQQGHYNSLVVKMNAEQWRALFEGAFPELQSAWINQHQTGPGEEQEMSWHLSPSSLNRSTLCQLQQSPTLLFCLIPLNKDQEKKKPNNKNWAILRGQIQPDPKGKQREENGSIATPAVNRTVRARWAKH